MGFVSKLRKSYFLRLSISFSVLSIVLIGVAGGILVTMANRTMLDEISKNSQYQLNNARTSLENSYLEKYEEAFLSKVMTTVNPQSQDEILYFLDNPVEDDYYRMIRLNNDLHTVSSVNEGIRNIALYFNISQKVVDRERYYDDIEHSPDAEFIRQLPYLQSQIWFTRVTSNNTKVLTYIYTLPYKSVGNRVKGYMFIDIDVAYLQNLLQGMLIGPSEQIYIYNQEGQPMLTTDKTSPSSQSLLGKHFQTSANGSWIDYRERNSNVVSYAPAVFSNNKWSYVTVQPLNSFFLASRELKNNIVTVCLLVLFLGLLITFIMSRRYYLPLQRLLYTIRSRYGIPAAFQQSNEYSIINGVLNTLDDRIITLNDELKEKQLDHLLKGNLDKLDHLPVPVHTEYIVVCVRLYEGDWIGFKHHIVHSPKQIFAPEMVCFDAAEAAIIYMTGQGNELKDELENMRAAAGGSFIFGAGIGRAVRSVEEIQNSYKDAQHAMKYTFLYGKTAVVSYERIEYRSQNLLKNINYDYYENALKAGDTEAIFRYLKEFRAELVDNEYPIELVNLALIQLGTALYRMMIEYRLNNELLSNINFFARITKDTLDGTLAEIRSLSGKIADFVNGNVVDAHAKLIESLEKYIESHLEEDISLDLLAQHVSRSPSHISKLFREVLNVSFTEYVTQVKMEKAAELLRDPSRSVTEIASCLGFRNSQYFCTKFKTRFGITPLQYRNSRHVEQLGF